LHGLPRLTTRRRWPLALGALPSWVDGTGWRRGEGVRRDWGGGDSE
jgi:hypothetical protein